MTYPFSKPFPGPGFKTSATPAWSFTDVLSDGAGTPVETFINAGRTTLMYDYQPFQRGRSKVVLYGKYSVTGGTPTGFAWRCGTGEWVRFTSETIGGGNWQGTLTIPSNYLAQGTFEVKPINGLNVTPFSKADISITDVWGVAGQSNAVGQADDPQEYTGTMKWITNSSGWVNRTGFQEWPSAGAKGSCFPRLAKRLSDAGIPPVIFMIRGASATGFSDGTNSWKYGDPPINGGLNYYNFILTAEAANLLPMTGGVAGVLWDLGENDADNIRLGTYTAAGYKTDFMDAYNGWNVETLNLDNAPFYHVQLVSSPAGTSGVNAMRGAVQELVAENPSYVRFGPGLLYETHTAHYGENQTPAETTNQCNNRGDAWFRCIAYYNGYPGADGLPYGALITSATVGTGANAAKITVDFDRAMTGHSGTNGWTITDGGGTAVTVSSSEQGASSSQVILTCNRALYGTVTVQYGDGASAQGTSLKDTSSIVGFSVQYKDTFNATGTGVGAAPAYVSGINITGTTTLGSTLTAVKGTWSGVPAIADPAGYTYQWKRNGTNITSATNSTYVIVADDVGQNVTVTVTATNAVGSANQTSSAVVPTSTLTPSSLFAASEKGAWFDASDLTKLYTDAGTTNATADGDLIQEWHSSAGPGYILRQTDNTKKPVLRIASGKYYLDFDGTNDFMSTTATMDLTGTDELTFYAGIRREGTGTDMVFEHSTGPATNNNCFFLCAPYDATSEYANFFKGAIGGIASNQVAVYNSGGATPELAVITATGDVSATSGTIRFNQIAGTDATGGRGTGGNGNHTLYVGGRAGTSLFFDGRIYQIVIRNKVSTGTEITDIEDFINTKVGAY